MTEPTHVDDISAQPPDDSALLRLRDVTVGYGKLMIVHGANIDVKEGEIVANIASAECSKASPHLHLTMGLAQKEITIDLLDWNMICHSKAVVLIDPIEHIGSYFLVSPSAMVQR